MAKGRMLNREVGMSMKFHELQSDTARLFATWTIAHLDKNGVFYGDPQSVRSAVFPMREDVTNAHVTEFLREMERVGLIVRFQAAGRTWQAWPGFAHNQTYLRKDLENTPFPEPPMFSDAPAPDLRKDSVSVVGEVPPNRIERKGKEGNGIEGKGKEQPNLDEAARAAGIDRLPSIRSKSAKAAAKKREADKYDTSDLQGYPSLQIYWDVFKGVLPPRELAQKIVDSVGEPARWEETCQEWAKGNPTTGKTWNPLSIDKMLDLYRAKCAQARANGPNGGAPAVSKADAALALLRERGHVA